MRMRIEVMAEHVARSWARSGERFEEMVRTKAKESGQPSFLLDGEGSTYYHGLLGRMKESLLCAGAVRPAPTSAPEGPCPLGPPPPYLPPSPVWPLTAGPTLSPPDLGLVGQGAPPSRLSNDEFAPPLRPPSQNTAGLTWTCAGGFGKVASPEDWVDDLEESRFEEDRDLEAFSLLRSQEEAEARFWGDKGDPGDDFDE